MTADPIGAPDPFNPAFLRLSQDPLAAVGVKKALIRVPVRRPSPQEYIRVHPGGDYRLDTAVIDLHDDREIYLVSSDLRGELFSEIKLVRLYTTISRQNVVAIWPCKLPGVDGRSNSWYDTALRAAELAMTRWTRIVADMSLGGYQPYIAAGDLPDPEWPEQTFAELLKIAFLKRAVVTTEAPAGPILLSLYADCGSQQGLKLSPRVVAVARKPNDETNEV